MSSTKALTKETMPPKTISQTRFSATWLIVRKEVYANLLNLKIPLAFAAMTILLLLSAHLLAIDYRQRFDNWAVNQSVQNVPPVGGVVAYKLPDGTFFHTTGTIHESSMQPPAPMSVVVKGMDSEWDRAITLGQTIGFGPRQDNRPARNLFDTPDAVYVIQLLVSLLALFFSLDAITWEKEMRTLHAMLATSVNRRAVLLGKGIGACLSLCVPFVVAYGISMAYLRLAHGVLVGRDEWLRVILILGMSLIYAVVFVCVGLLLSTITVRTKTAVVTALLVWGALVLVLPNAAVLSAKLLFPAPSYNQLKAQLRESRQQIIDQELHAHPEIKSVFESPNAREVLSRTFDADRQITDDYVARKWRQVARARYLSMLSPAGALKFGASDLAGTGANSFQSYLGFLVSGRDLMIDAMNRQWDLQTDEKAKFIQQAMEHISSRQRKPEPLSAGLGPSAIGAGSLLTWAGILGFLAYRRFQQYDAR